MYLEGYGLIIFQNELMEKSHEIEDAAQATLFVAVIIIEG